MIQMSTYILIILFKSAAGQGLALSSQQIEYKNRVDCQDTANQLQGKAYVAATYCLEKR